MELHGGPFIVGAETALLRRELSADRRLAAPEARQLPDAGTAGIEVAADVRVDDVRLAARDRHTCRFREIGGLVDADAVDSGRPRERCEVGVVRRLRSGVLEIGRQLAAVEVPALKTADR